MKFLSKLKTELTKLPYSTDAVKKLKKDIENQIEFDSLKPAKIVQSSYAKPRLYHEINKCDCMECKFAAEKEVNLRCRASVKNLIKLANSLQYFADNLDNQEIQTFLKYFRTAKCENNKK